jgi:hypothetical protein
MKNTVETLAKRSKSNEVSFLNKSYKAVALKVEEFIVRKTQSERRRALFGQDPLMEINKF